MVEKTKSFDEILAEAVDEGLKTLGESGKHMIFFYLEKDFSLRKDEISKNPEALAQGLEKIFKAGASVLEKIIIEKLYLKLGLKYRERSNFSFIDYVKKAKEEVQKKPLM
ncbi:MAG: hypothetical protein QW270_06955 [Candidatus Bathyarchaeia archaeon]